MPQLDLITFYPIIITTAKVFFLTYFGLQLIIQNQLNFLKI